MTTTTDDLNAQKKQAEDQKRLADQQIAKQKVLLRENLTAIDRDIAALQAQKTRINADLNKL